MTAKRLSSPAPDVSVIVPFYNRRNEVAACLESILRQRVEGFTFEVIAIDNGSTDGTREALEDFPVRVVDCARRGPAAARNEGIKAARGGIVAMTDSDCVVSRNWLVQLVEPFRDERVLLSGGRIRAFDVETGPALFSEVYGVINQRKLFLARDEFPPYFATANAAFRREALAAVGGFDEELWMCEDADLCWRVLERGGSIAYNPAAVVRHRHRSTIPGLYHQSVGYGAGTTALFVKHRKKMKSRARLDLGALFLLAIAPVRIPFRALVARDSFGKRWAVYETLWLTGFLAGRWKAAWKHKVFYL
ncbi:MAG: hypothetical protein PWP23_164 [Candidatus Sumerlaeota bacterium]|nr:hypothetical protein [Candidatus Sumerlaeota bacterium]